MHIMKSDGNCPFYKKQLFWDNFLEEILWAFIQIKTA